MLIHFFLYSDFIDFKRKNHNNKHEQSFAGLEYMHDTKICQTEHILTLQVVKTVPIARLHVLPYYHSYPVTSMIGNPIIKIEKKIFEAYIQNALW